MLRCLDEIRGYTVLARDEEIGSVADLLFDDQEWRVRYLLVDTGRWLPGRKVLLIPDVAGDPDHTTRTITIDLDVETIRHSPPIEADAPVSRQYQQELVRYYGWVPYWGPMMAPGAAAEPVLVKRPPPPDAEERSGDPHLRSLHEVTGYRVAATDERIGHIDDLIVETGTWIIRYLVVDTRNWLPGRKVLIAPDWCRAFDYLGHAATVDLSAEQVRESPPFDAGQAVNRVYEERLYDFYGRPFYWR